MVISIRAVIFSIVVNIEIKTNATDVAKLLDQLAQTITTEQVTLFKSLGVVFVDRVKKRISSKNDGQWEPAGRFIRAKKGFDNVLDGADRYVYFRATDNSLVIGGDTGKDWTLSMHDEGFFADPHDEAYKGGYSQIEIKDPAPLALPPGRAEFTWEGASAPQKVPARKIWDDDGEVVATLEPAATRWLQAIVDRIAK